MYALGTVVSDCVDVLIFIIFAYLCKVINITFLGMCQNLNKHQLDSDFIYRSNVRLYLDM